MTPEQERKFYELFEHVVETKSMVSGMHEVFAAHEKRDAETHADADERIAKVERKQTQLGAYYAAACVIVPVILWVLGWLMKASASAL